MVAIAQVGQGMPPVHKYEVAPAAVMVSAPVQRSGRSNVAVTVGVP